MYSRSTRAVNLSTKGERSLFGTGLAFRSRHPSVFRSRGASLADFSPGNQSQHVLAPTLVDVITHDSVIAIQR